MDKNGPSSAVTIVQRTEKTGTPMNKLGYCLIPVVLASALSAVAKADDQTQQIFDDRFYIASNNAVKDGFGGTLAFGKSLVPHVGAELVGSYLYYKGRGFYTPPTSSGCALLGVVPLIGPCPGGETNNSGQRVYGGGLGVNLYLSPTNKGLFAHGDAMGGNKFVYDGGVGYDLPLTAPGLGLRAEALYHKSEQQRGQALINLGIFFPFGDLPPPAQPVPEPVAVVPVEEPAPPPPPPPAPPPCETPAPGQPINLEGCKTGDTLVLRGVNFEFNKANLTVNAKTLLDQVADALLARKDIKVEIDGYTDGKGSVSYNLKLSDHRAASVRKYLTERGVDAGRMTSKGFGKSHPIADNATDEGRELNRRVELRITDSAGPGVVVAPPEGSTAPTDTGATTPPPVTPATDSAAPADSGATAPAAQAYAAPADTGAAPPADASAPAPAGDAGSTPPSDSGSSPAPAPAP